MDARSVTFFCILAASGWVTWTKWRLDREREEAERKSSPPANPYAPPPPERYPRIDNSDLNELLEKARLQVTDRDGEHHE